MEILIEFDALSLVTDELKEKLLPISRRLKEVDMERAEKRKVRKRTKKVAASSATAASNDVELDVSAGTVVEVQPLAVETATATIVEGGRAQRQGESG